MDGSSALAAMPEAQTNALAEGQAFLAKNAAASGVETLASGVQYKVIHGGPQGGSQPSAEDDVVIHYEGRFLSGQVFDSSYTREEPRRAPLSGLIPGWIEVLQIMRPGDVWEVYIPPELAYGSRGRGPVPGDSVLVFKIELLGAYPPEGSDGEEFH